MCLIIDANTVHKVFPSPSEAHQPVRRALDKKSAKMVYGGELRREYLKIKWFRPFLLRLDQAGSAKAIPDGEVDAQTASLVHAGGYESDDPHILALARVANVRLLCSDDDSLSTDFKDKRFLADPRGNVYRQASHAHLLRKHCAKSTH